MANLKAVEDFISDFYLLIASGIVAVLLFFIREYISTSFVAIVEYIFKVKIYKHQGMSSDSIYQAARIQDILAELRIRANCDRAYILQFHNGSIFTTKNQMWKISITHESINQVRSRIGELQNILSSALSDVLYPYWDDDNTIFQGITKLTKSDCPSCINNTCIGGVFFHDIEKLPTGFAKGSFTAGDVKYALRTAILDSDYNKVGILCLDFCWSDSNIEKIKSLHFDLCRTASLISFELSNTPKK